MKRGTVLILFLCQLVLVGAAGWQNRHLLNADGIAYARLGQCYAEGKVDLAVSGYWGPLLSWLMAPWIFLGLAPLAAARIGMALSAIVFFLGGHLLLRHSGWSSTRQAVCLGIIGLTGAVWSVTEITPDLMLAGLVAFACGGTVMAGSSGIHPAPWKVGVYWGLAYMCKAVALPLALAVSVTLSWHQGVALGIPWRTVAKRLQIILTVTLLVAAPWVTVISLKYHRLTFSTSAAIAHAVEGPPDVDRYHPYAIQFHRPPAGRLTMWEDPSEMPYHYWHPWANAAYAQHQVQLMFRNLWSAGVGLTRLDLVGLGLWSLLLTGFAWMVGLGVIKSDGTTVGSLGTSTHSGMDSPGGVALGRVGRGGTRPSCWRTRVAEITRAWWGWAVLPVVCLVGIYLPVHATEGRFYYPAFLPLLLVAFGITDQVVRWIPQATRLAVLAPAVVSLCFAGPALVLLPGALMGYRDPAVDCAWDLAGRLKSQGIEGPIAGSAMIAGQRAGLYVAFLLQRPWHGDERHPTPESFEESGAAMMLLRRQDPAVERFLANPGLKDLDDRLFSSPEDAAAFPVRAFMKSTDP